MKAKKSKVEFKEFVLEVCELEGKVTQVNVAQTSEELKVIAELFANRYNLRAVTAFLAKHRKK